LSGGYNEEDGPQAKPGSRAAPKIFPKSPPAVTISFSDCTLDTERRLLLRGGRPVHLTPKALRLLEALLSARPRALSKEELYQLLWPGTFVGDASLSVAVAALRKALGDSAEEPRFVRTLHGFGYAWCGEGVEEAVPARRRPEAPGCSLLWHAQELPLGPGENLLGRDRGADVVVDDPGISRRHARIVVEAGAATLEDLGSKNGTRLNGRAVERPTALSDGDRLEVGPVTLVFRSSPASGSTLTVRR
jgi:DNA-binding winged helix-turn-helix (wHTH) protein